MKPLFFSLCIFFAGCTAGAPLRLPGKISNEQILLPNGWKLSPAGTSVALGDLPLGIDLSYDGKFAAIVNSGESGAAISVVDLVKKENVQTIRMASLWNGVRFLHNSDEFYVTTGNENSVVHFVLHSGSAEAIDTIRLGKKFPADNISPTDLDVSSDDSTLFVVTKGNNSVYKIDRARKIILLTLKLKHELYSCVYDNVRRVLFVSVWGGKEIAAVEADSLRLLRTIPVGDHPTEMVETKSSKRLFVANANNNSVSVIDLDKSKVIETISISLSPNALNGSTPNSVALSEDDKMLFVANADNNCLAVIDVSKFGQSRSTGFIPTGWYPTEVRVVNNELLVTNGKGETSKANPHHEYIGGLFRGTLSFIPMPTNAELQHYSAQVFQNTPLTHMEEMPRHEPNNPIPVHEGEASPIKHVFYIIKENRTYDQVFGDILRGNGDSSLCLFGAGVTPNEHAIADEFALLDNFYVDAEVSADGHNWSMAAYATDYVEKTWPTFYGGRGGEYDFEEEGIASPSEGYIWDNCIRHGVSLRNYGEFWDEGKVTAKGLQPRTCPDYRGWDLKYPDVERAQAWEKEFVQYEAGDSLPQFEIIRLPNDHTAGTRKGSLSPRAMVADNDRAVGMVVDRISHSKYWNESAIFVLEDDAQDGPDHVDAHRSTALVISPYVKHHFVDHTMYSTSGMIRTMELILGLPPMTQYDAGAAPMYFAFTPEPNLVSYDLRKPRIDLHEKNTLGAYGQRRMETMNLRIEDAAPDHE
ncbi:MAG: bifunctional YncE family protein/alkaline phosphatase family protein, partial [Bacteroidota bacterium]|nr:bifunctional YncE family protein/alkaline phosphatase family protein [Bacteroidota bacterium]